jgi:hypothetical protein
MKHITIDQSRFTINIDGNHSNAINQNNQTLSNVPVIFVQPLKYKDRI